MVNAKTRQFGISVLTLSNEDLLDHGFDPERFTDEMFADILRRLQKHYDNTFSDALNEIATTVISL